MSAMAMIEAESFRADVRYAADREAVYAALAAPGGDNGWWSADGDVVSGEGARVRLNWSETDYVEFRIDAARAPRRMLWTCVAQRDRNLPRADEWVGTALSFTLEADADGTLLRFEHRGLVPRLECYGVCAGGWDFFLRRSVRQLVELGAGIPYRAGG